MYPIKWKFRRLDRHACEYLAGDGSIGIYYLIRKYQLIDLCQLSSWHKLPQTVL